MRRVNKYIDVQTFITENRWGIKEEALYDIVLRKNKKRSFLFASKVLGKYIKTHPLVPIRVGHLLAELFYESIAPYEKQKKIHSRIYHLVNALEKGELEEESEYIKYPLCKKTLFIGFAETATGLGLAMFTKFTNCTYVHTTRINVTGSLNELFFSEDHSHAPDHYCLLEGANIYAQFERVVLVDDEITTGNTARHLIEQLNKTYHIKDFVVIALLDWRNEEDLKAYEVLEETLHISVRVISVLKGELKVKVLQSMEHMIDNPVSLELCHEKVDYTTLHFALDNSIYHRVKRQDGTCKDLVFLEKVTGRFGLKDKEVEGYELRAWEIGKRLRKLRNYSNTLCLGTEEFIYWPCKIASFMGENIKFESSARSPIITSKETSYILKDAVSYTHPEDAQLVNYIYNLQDEGYEEIFWFLEREVDEEFKEKMASIFYKLGIKKLWFVVLTL